VQTLISESEEHISKTRSKAKISALVELAQKQGIAVENSILKLS
jgi:hypothetical protein